MEEIVLRLSLRPGTAQVLHQVAQALGTTVEEIAARHLETLKEALSCTSAESEPDSAMKPLNVVPSESNRWLSGTVNGPGHGAGERELLQTVRGGERRAAF